MSSVHKEIKLTTWKNPENLLIRENACCLCGIIQDQLFHLKDIHGIHGDYCNVCFAKVNNTLVKHKHLYPIRYNKHDRPMDSNSKKYVIYEKD